MRPGETLIEMARRHVREGERLLAQQHLLIARLQRLALPTEQAEALLTEFEATLAEHRASLGQMLEDQRTGRRDAAGQVRFDRP